jgi:hypothetical protein
MNRFYDVHNEGQFFFVRAYSKCGGLMAKTGIGADFACMAPRPDWK